MAPTPNIQRHPTNWSHVCVCTLAMTALTMYTIKIPRTTPNWLVPTKRPRMRAGEISEMYIGETMEATPIPSPPINLDSTNIATEFAAAQPRLEMTNSTPANRRTGFLPARSLRNPATSTPIMAPKGMLADTNPVTPGLI
ncbi:hypothetical protein GCM10025857_27640 [Alicyclobacillus contaminans]|nr:hypothetical protein GCM10025857_27640 [Alicyclobacillus contaminans]